MQGILRQVDIEKLLINRFMKHIYYSKVAHEKTFQYILDLLFYYCINNTVNQQSMKH